MRIGHKYEVLFKDEADHFKVLVGFYLGMDYKNCHLFDLRPVAGTTAIHAKHSFIGANPTKECCLLPRRTSLVG